MKSIFKSLFLVFAIVSISSCSKNEDIGTIDQSRYFVAKWKLDYGVVTDDGESDRQRPDYDSFLIVENNGTLRVEEHDKSFANGVRVTRGDYDLKNRYIMLENVDSPNKEDRYEIIGLGDESLHIVHLKTNYQLELFFNKVK